MDFRKWLKEKPAVFVVAMIVLLGLAIWYASHSLSSSGQLERQTKAFFTDDDGKTWFVDSLDRVPPFDHGGKQAVRAQLFTCSDKMTPFVAYLERYTPEYKKRLEDSIAAVAAGKQGTTFPGDPSVVSRGLEMKKPGNPNWLPPGDLEGKDKLHQNLCPSGGVLDMVLP